MAFGHRKPVGMDLPLGQDVDDLPVAHAGGDLIGAGLEMVFQSLETGGHPEGIRGLDQFLVVEQGGDVPGGHPMGHREPDFLARGQAGVGVVIIQVPVPPSQEGQDQEDPDGQ